MATKREVRPREQAPEVASYLRGQYVRMIIPNAEEGGYLAEVLELPGCVTDGDTPEEAYRNLEEAMAGWIKASLDTNRPIPDPVGIREYSGHFPLRMSTELHRVAALRAMQEGVSLNQWIAAAIAEKVTKADLAEQLAEKIAPKVAERMRFAFFAYGMQTDTVASTPKVTELQVDPSQTGTVIESSAARASLAPGLPGTIHIAEGVKEVKQNA